MKHKVNKILLRNRTIKMSKLDEEWVQLIIESKKLGINKNDVRAFLKNPIIPPYK